MLAFDTNNWKLSLTALGPKGTNGYVKVTVVKGLIADIAHIRVFMDGRQSDFSIVSLDNSWLLSFTYEHSIHQVVMDFDIKIIPEFPSLSVILLFVIATFSVALIRMHRIKLTLC